MSFTPGQRSAFVTSAVPGSKAFFRFMLDSDGAELLSILEQSGRLLFHVSATSLVVDHDPQISVQQVATILHQKWKEIFMKKALQISLLSQQCTTSKTLVFPLSQAALIFYYRYQIIREHKIVDLLVDSSGSVSWYGQYDCVASASRHIVALVQEHFPDKSVQSAPELYSDPVSKNNTANMGSVMNDSYGFSNLGNLSLGLSALAGVQNSWNPEELLRCLAGTASTYSLMQQASGDASNTTQLPTNLPETFKRERPVPRVSLTGSASSQKKRERIYFMVPSTDAPRLIGTRGVNKKRIEEQTGCSITLHTESKKDGEFPVEIIGASSGVCERAKLHIEKFLASNGNSDEKKERSKPKVHLEFSPRKTQPTSSPQKSEADENSNW